MKRILMGLVLMVLLAQSVSALDWENSCLNDTHLFKEGTFYYNGIGYGFNQTVYCQHGCNNVSGICNPMPETKTYYHAIGIIMLVIAMYLMFVIIRTSHGEEE